MKQILDAILAGDTPAEVGELDVPDHYRGVTVHTDEAAMFDGPATAARQGPAQEPAPGRRRRLPELGPGRGRWSR